MALAAMTIAYSILNAAPTIYVVDMAEVYSNYYKAKEAHAQINASAETTKQELQKMDKKRQELIAEIEKINEKANNPALTDDAKKKIFDSEAKPKIVEVQKIETDMRNISQQAQQSLNQNLQQVQKIHMDEIREIVKKLAEEKKADFIIEKRSCYFVQPTSELTQDLIKMVNATEKK